MHCTYSLEFKLNALGQTHSNALKHSALMLKHPMVWVASTRRVAKAAALLPKCMGSMQRQECPFHNIEFRIY